MVNIAVRVGQPLVRIQIEVPYHVLVNLFLEVHSYNPIDANDFVGAHASIGGNVASGIRNGNVVRDVSDVVMGAFNGRSDELAREVFTIQVSAGVLGKRNN